MDTEDVSSPSGMDSDDDWAPPMAAELHISAKVDRFFNRFHRFPEEEEMELSEGEWDEIEADEEDASAEKMGAGTPAETVAAGAASEARDEVGAGMPAASSHEMDASAASADAAEPAEGASTA